eukprot:355371-Chlamydomonas_euryale.AAC.10
MQERESGGGRKGAGTPVQHSSRKPSRSMTLNGGVAGRVWEVWSGLGCARKGEQRPGTPFYMGGDAARARRRRTGATTPHGRGDVAWARRRRMGAATSHGRDSVEMAWLCETVATYDLGRGAPSARAAAMLVAHGSAGAGAPERPQQQFLPVAAGVAGAAAHAGAGAGAAAHAGAAAGAGAHAGDADAADAAAGVWAQHLYRQYPPRRGGHHRCLRGHCRWRAPAASDTHFALRSHRPRQPRCGRCGRGLRHCRRRCCRWPLCRRRRCCRRLLVPPAEAATAAALSAAGSAKSGAAAAAAAAVVGVAAAVVAGGAAGCVAAAAAVAAMSQRVTLRLAVALQRLPVLGSQSSESFPADADRL